LAPYARGGDIVSSQAINGLQELIRGNWSLARTAIAGLVYPSGPSERQRWFADFLRRSVSPETAARYVEFHATVDVTAYLPRVPAPTLILHARGYRNVPIRAGRDVAALMPDARFIAMDGDTMGTLDPGGSGYAAVAEFLDEGQGRASSPTPEPGSGTAIILFADIADSTALTERLGDAAFREKARALDEALREAITSNGGTAIEGKLLGDGVLAVFTSAREAIACAQACHEAGSHAGLPLHLGIHAGDVIREEGNVYGGAVNIASRVAGEAAAGETFVSGTVRDLARTSAGVSFEDRGERELKGVGEPVRVWAVRGG
jgi:class 3 adenylate cyclase